MPQLAPRRRLPWDVLVLVFKEADPSTLAALGGVSYDFLASTTPLLYHTVEVYSKEQLEALFCEREEVRKTFNLSRINALLSLTHIRNLYVDFTTMIPSSTDVLVFNLSSSRMVNSAPIPLDSIQTTCTHFHASQILASLYSYLFPHLNPTRLFITTFTHDRTFQSPINLAVPRLKRWTRIEVLELRGCMPFSWTVGIADCLGALPALALDRRRVLRFHIETLPTYNWHHPSSLPNVLMERHSVLGLGLMQDGSIVLVVRSEEERKETEKGLREVMKEKWRHLFVVEMED